MAGLFSFAPAKVAESGMENTPTCPVAAPRSSSKIRSVRKSLVEAYVGASD